MGSSKVTSQTRYLSQTR